MSITLGVFAQSPEPEAHDKVLDNNPDRIGVSREKPLGAKTITNNKFNPLMTPNLGPHWRKASVVPQFYGLQCHRLGENTFAPVIYFQ